MRVSVSRQSALLTAAVASLASVAVPGPARATAGSAQLQFPSQQQQIPPSIKQRLDSKDSRLLVKPLNSGLSPPTEAQYPPWLEGDWKGVQNFAGYELPAKDVLSRDELFAYADVPGFKKLSIAMLPDVGKENVPLTLSWYRDANGAVREDRVANLRSAIRGGLGYDAIERIDYKDDSNNPFGLSLGNNPFNSNDPNRLRLIFAPGLTKNADRIELFVNARETEAPKGREDDLFYTAEAMRQVTFSGTSARQVNGEYCHFVSYRRVTPDRMVVVVVTAIYADPLGAERLYVKAGGRRPIILFSHTLQLSKV